MCGRISQTFNSFDLLDYFALAKPQVPEPRYNLAPSQDLAAVRMEGEERRLASLRWGLIPFWAKEAKIGYRMFNARAETAHRLPAFRAAFRARRCLIPASGFYEWDRLGGSKQPWFIRRGDGHPLALAGLWEDWEERGGAGTIESCAILTTAAAGPLARLHDRMPVILEPEDFERWLDPVEGSVERLRQLLQPAAGGVLELYPVSRFVNKAGNEGERCVEPVALGGDEPGCGGQGRR
jgi:putative SOS response-associated peptidase YedK